MECVSCTVEKSFITAYLQCRWPHAWASALPVAILLAREWTGHAKIRSSISAASKGINHTLTEESKVGKKSKCSSVAEKENEPTKRARSLTKSYFQIFVTLNNWNVHTVRSVFLVKVPLIGQLWKQIRIQAFHTSVDLECCRGSPQLSKIIKMEIMMHLSVDANAINTGWLKMRCQPQVFQICPIVEIHQKLHFRDLWIECFRGCARLADLIKTKLIFQPSVDDNPKNNAINEKCCFRCHSRVFQTCQLSKQIN